MTLLTIQDVQIFYLTMMVGAMAIAAIMSVGINKQGKHADTETRHALTFILLIILSYGLPPLGRLLSFLFPASFDNLELMSSLYKIISLFNNLFILLTVRSLPGIRQRFPQIGVLPLVVGFVVINMILLLADKFVLQGIPIGKAAIVVIDTVISISCLLLFTDAFQQFFSRYQQRFLGWILLFRINIGVLVGLLTFSAMLFFAKTFFGYVGPTTGVLICIYSLYLITSMLFVFYLLGLSQYLVAVNPVAAIHPDLSSKHTDNAVAADASEPDVTQVVLNVRVVGEKPNQSQFILELASKQGERLHLWQSDNCIYPYFYWIYLHVGQQLNITVEMKNAQVMRNKMIQVLGKAFKPTAWIQLKGDQAALVVEANQLVIDAHVFQHPAIKNKFRLHIDPFLRLIEYDAQRYERDRMYNEYVFLTVYEELLRQLTKSELPGRPH